MKLKASLLGLLLVIWIPCLSAENVYMYRDSNGVLIFTDQPKDERAKQISVKAKISSFPKYQSKTQTKAVATDSNITPKIKVLQPKSQATIRDNQGNLSIAISLSPVPEYEYNIELLLDGVRINTPTKKLIHHINNVYRGEHELKVNLLDNSGKLLASSEPVTFYMHRTTISGAK
ncbi:DUF4124 domain-containing protein [Catenovulum maritimum]|uniref:DUF4124 domain-containing protein n=1 Tax=Catenovulum maritimum TaxID=1513271 RepID=A0A0J8GV70_9ALTE|nr:DUF4124 domain-containing protein [Catenovulum maritimum]KMT64568.1 hypothetical protein XM47_14040 [Catenovulum maritimum]